MSNERSWTPVTGGAKRAGAYSPAVIAGDYVFLSGQVPVDLETDQLVGSTVTEQTHATLDRVAFFLARAGLSLDDVVSATIYLSDINDWDEFNNVWKQRFREPYPARTTVGAQLHGFLVEITVVAYQPSASS